MPKVYRRATPDPGGKRVDVYPFNPTISAIALRPFPGMTEATVRDLLIDYLTTLAASADRRRTHRTFTIFFGGLDDPSGERLFVIGLPERLDSGLHVEIHRNLASLAPIAEVSSSEAADVNADPLLRYEDGVVCFYADPFLSPDAVQLGPQIEVRSYEYASEPADAPRRRYPTPKTETRDSLLHSIETWSQDRVRMLEYIYETVEPESYTALRRRLRRSFGIRVVERPSLGNRLGLIAVDWVDVDENVEVTISIAKALDPGLKYVVTTHELAHFVLHFPLLLLGQMVEQAAWETPALEDVHSGVLRRVLGSDFGLLEHHADIFASNLLVPPRFDLDRMATLMVEQGRTPTGPELAWRFLQPYFPDRSHVNYGWRNWREMYDQAEKDLALVAIPSSIDDKTLFSSFLLATSRRNTDASHELNRRLSEKIANIWADFPDGWDGKLPPVSNGDGNRGLPLDQEQGQHRRTIEPAVATRSSRRIPLVALSLGGERWVDVRENAGDYAASIGEWQRAHRGDWLLLYDGMCAPTRPLWVP